MLFGAHTQLAEESVMPDFLEVIPVDDPALVDRVLQVKYIILCLGLFTHEDVFLVQTSHDT